MSYWELGFEFARRLDDAANISTLAWNFSTQHGIGRPGNSTMVGFGPGTGAIGIGLGDADASRFRSMAFLFENTLRSIIPAFEETVARSERRTEQVRRSVKIVSAGALAGLGSILLVLVLVAIFGNRMAIRNIHHSLLACKVAFALPAPTVKKLLNHYKQLERTFRHSIRTEEEERQELLDEEDPDACADSANLGEAGVTSHLALPAPVSVINHADATNQPNPLDIVEKSNAVQNVHSPTSVRMDVGNLDWGTQSRQGAPLEDSQPSQQQMLQCPQPPKQPVVALTEKNLSTHMLLQREASGNEGSRATLHQSHPSPLMVSVLSPAPPSLPSAADIVQVTTMKGDPQVPANVFSGQHFGNSLELQSRRSVFCHTYLVSGAKFGSHTVVDKDPSEAGACGDDGERGAKQQDTERKHVVDEASGAETNFLPNASRISAPGAATKLHVAMHVTGPFRTDAQSLDDSARVGGAPGDGRDCEEIVAKRHSIEGLKGTDPTLIEPPVQSEMPVSDVQATSKRPQSIMRKSSRESVGDQSLPGSIFSSRRPLTRRDSFFRSHSSSVHLSDDEHTHDSDSDQPQHVARHVHSPNTVVWKGSHDRVIVEGHAGRKPSSTLMEAGDVEDTSSGDEKQQGLGRRTEASRSGFQFSSVAENAILKAISPDRPYVVRASASAIVLGMVAALCCATYLRPEEKLNSLISMAPVLNQAARRRYLLRTCIHLARELALDDNVTRLSKRASASALNYYLGEFTRSDKALRLGNDLGILQGGDSLGVQHNQIMYREGCPWRTAIFTHSYGENNTFVAPLDAADATSHGASNATSTGKLDIATACATPIRPGGTSCSCS